MTFSPLTNARIVLPGFADSFRNNLIEGRSYTFCLYAIPKCTSGGNAQIVMMFNTVFIFSQICFVSLNLNHCFESIVFIHNTYRLSSMQCDEVVLFLQKPLFLFLDYAFKKIINVTILFLSSLSTLSNTSGINTRHLETVVLCWLKTQI